MRPVIAIVSTAVVIVLLAAWYIIALAAWPTATVQAISTGPKQAVLNINTVANAGGGPHPDWVQYQTRDVNAHASATIYKVPVDTWVTVDIHQYDSATPLRNPYFGLVFGTKGNMAYLNGKPFKAIAPDQTSHTFAIPALGVSVPLQGVASNAPATAFEDVRFSFFTGHQRTMYHWQCFVPCGWGAYGNGGPMQTFGYMDGQLIVE